MEGVSFFARLLRIAWPAAPVSSSSAYEAGVAALERRRFGEALALFERALAGAGATADRAQIHNKQGIVHLRRGDRDGAIEAFAAALMADARFVPVIVNIGNLLFEDGAIDEAIEHYEAALRIDDEYPGAHLNLGVAYKRLGRRADAVHEFRRASRLEARLRRGLR